MRLDKLTDYYCNTELLDEIRALLAPSYALLGSFIMRGLTESIPGMEAQLLLLRDEAGLDCVLQVWLSYERPNTVPLYWANCRASQL